MLNLKPNWKFIDVQENIEALISQYNGELMPFLCIHLKQKNIIRDNMKKQVFNYNNLLYWQRERLWEVLNGDCELEIFKNIGR